MHFNPFFLQVFFFKPFYFLYDSNHFTQFNDTSFYCILYCFWMFCTEIESSLGKGREAADKSTSNLDVMMSWAFVLFYRANETLANQVLLLGLESSHVVTMATSVAYKSLYYFRPIDTHSNKAASYTHTHRERHSPSCVPCCTVINKKTNCNVR